MADKDLEKRLAALEKGLRAAEARAEAAEQLAEAKTRELKELKAHARDRQVQLASENNQLRSMRQLHGPESAYANDSRETYEALKQATVKTKDGMRHYYAPQPAYVAGVYHPAESIISIPADQDPSVTWLPVKVGGKDAKTGALVFVPLESPNATAKEPDPGQEVEEGEVDAFTNTDVNAKQAAKRAGNAQLGAGAPVAPTPPQRPGSNEPAGQTARPSDTDVG